VCPRVLSVGDGGVVPARVRDARAVARIVIVDVSSEVPERAAKGSRSVEPGDKRSSAGRLDSHILEDDARVVRPACYRSILDLRLLGPLVEVGLSDKDREAAIAELRSVINRDVRPALHVDSRHIIEPKVLIGHV
jgi:hypothetical protein